MKKETGLCRPIPDFLQRKLRKIGITFHVLDAGVI